MNSWVFCGYPEKFIQEGSSPIYYNSQLVVSPDGKFAGNYRKFYLFDTDKSWCTASPDGFKTMDIELPRSKQIIRIGHGICMDINPVDFKEEEYPLYRFATFHRDQGTQLILFSSAWLDPNSQGNEKKDV